VAALSARGFSRFGAAQRRAGPGAAEPGSILITATVDRVAALAMTGRPNLP